MERYQAPRVFQVIQIIGNVIVDCGTINASRKRCFYPLLAYAKVPLDDVKKIYNRHVQKNKQSFKARFLIKEGINNEDCYGKVFFLRRGQGMFCLLLLRLLLWWWWLFLFDVIFIRCCCYYFCLLLTLLKLYSFVIVGCCFYYFCLLLLKLY